MQAISLVKQQAAIIKIPAAIKEIPPNRWLFFQVVSFFMLQPVRRPIREFIRSLGIIFPTTTIDSPKRPQTSWLISIRTEERDSTPPKAVYRKKPVIPSKRSMETIPITRHTFSLLCPFSSRLAQNLAIPSIKRPNKRVTAGRIRASYLLPHRLT